ncbi:hypothetical protein JCM10207_001489 [Rhodosporidiobolus poonsookiae]
MPAPRLPSALVAARFHLASSSSFASSSGIAHRAFASASTACSHVGSAPVLLPAAVTFTPPPPASPSHALVSGPKGQLAVPIPAFVRLAVQPSTSSAESPSASSAVTVEIQDASLKHQRAGWGLTRSLLANAVVGVSEGYTLPLRLVGVGYRAAVEAAPASPSSPSSTSPPQRLNLKLGFAHPVYVDLPADVQATTPTPTSILLHGIDKQRLGEVAAHIRRWRVPEPYNGKGIFVGDEQVRRKEVKKK